MNINLPLKNTKIRIYLFYIIYLGWSINFLNLINYVGLNREIFHFILLIGIYLSTANTLIKHNLYPNYKSIIIASILNLFILLRGSFLVNNEDKFSYFITPLLLLSFLLLNCKFSDLKLFRKAFLISILYLMYGILDTPISILIIPITTLLTWVSLASIGFQTSMIEFNKIIFENKGILIDIGCSGSDMIIFSLSTTLIYYLFVPLKNKLHTTYTVIIGIILPFLINILRITILGLAILFWDNEFLFEFFHKSYGSLLFSLFATILASEVYKYFLFKDKLINDY